jgi:hypothetical protein
MMVKKVAPIYERGFINLATNNDLRIIGPINYIIRIITMLQFNKEQI